MSWQVRTFQTSRWVLRAATHWRHHAHHLLCSILGHRAAPLCSAAEDLNNHPSKCLFVAILCPFSIWPLETANQWTNSGSKTGVTGVRRMVLPRRDALLAQSWTSTFYKTLLMQDEGHRWSTPSSSWTAFWRLTHVESVRATVTLWRLYTTLRYKPGDSQAGVTQRLPACPHLPLLPELEALVLAALRGAGMILFLQDYSCTPTIRERYFHPTQIFHQWPEREERLIASHPTRSFKTQQIPHQGGELVFSLTGPLIYLFKGYPRQRAGKNSFPMLPTSSDLQQDSQTFPGSLHPQTLARSLFNTSQQTARSFILQRHNLNMGNKFTFSLETLLWA